MEFATSLSTGRTYEAFKVSYSQAKTLKLVCPVCKEKVFKRVRHIPHETHMFAHHKGGSPDCELYFPAATYGSPISTDKSISRGQTFDQFVRDIDSDLQELLISSGLIEGQIDERFLVVISVLVEKEANYLAPSFAVAEFSGHGVLGTETGLANDIAALIFEFYTRDGARFIDALLCKWVLYSFHVKQDRPDIRDTLSKLIRGKRVLFSKLAGLMLAGLAWLYADENLTRFSAKFTSIWGTESPSDYPQTVILPKGRFVMGSPRYEAMRDAGEPPASE